MKFLLPLTVIALLSGGCASYTARRDIVSVYTDKSPSPLTEKEACAIAKREAQARDHFVDERNVRNRRAKVILVSAKRMNDGGWRAIARASETNNGVKGGCGCIVFMPNVPAAVVTIDAGGKVTGYTRYTNDQITVAENAAAGKRG